MVFGFHKNNSRLHGNGDVKRIKRQVPVFNHINFGGIGVVFVHFGDWSHVKIITDSNIEPYIVTVVRNDTLYIDVKSDSSINNVTALRIDVYTRHIESVVHTGVGNITLNKVDTDTLSIDSSGTGCCTITGKGEHFDIHMRGVGKIDGKGFTVKTAKVVHIGVGPVTVWATDILDAVLSGIGNITYYGDPQVISRVNSIGTIKQDKQFL
jgi:hypothetical protein